MTAIVNEFTKMRGLRLWPLLVAMVLVVFGGTALGIMSVSYTHLTLPTTPYV